MIKSLKLAVGNFCVRLIKFLARKAKLDLIRIAYSENGITKSYSYQASGEKHFIGRFLKENIKTEAPVFFDVGGNKGDYSAMLRENFPQAEIYCFEPNPKTFQLLKHNLDGRARLFNLGVGDKEDELQLYYDASDETSVQATSDPEILKVIAKKEDLKCLTIRIVTLDDFCREQNIDSIDLLKIDTEGFELEVLNGASRLLAAGAVKMIQFEFNEVNIVKRRFLRDFYDLLDGFEFYRLDENRLIPLNEWQPVHEIFMFQNICAIKR